MWLSERAMGVGIRVLAFLLMAAVGAVQSELTTAYAPATTFPACVDIYRSRTNFGHITCEEKTSFAQCGVRVGGYLNRTLVDADIASFHALTLVVIPTAESGCPLDVRTVVDGLIKGVLQAAVAIRFNRTLPDDAVTMSANTSVPTCIAVFAIRFLSGDISCASTVEFIKCLTCTSIDDLRSLPAEEVQRRGTALQTMFGMLGLNCVIDLQYIINLCPNISASTASTPKESTSTTPTTSTTESTTLSTATTTESTTTPTTTPTIPTTPTTESTTTRTTPTTPTTESMTPTTPTTPTTESMTPTTPTNPTKESMTPTTPTTESTTTPTSTTSLTTAGIGASTRTSTAQVKPANTSVPTCIAVFAIRFLSGDISCASTVEFIACLTCASIDDLRSLPADEVQRREAALQTLIWMLELHCVINLEYIINLCPNISASTASTATESTSTTPTTSTTESTTLSTATTTESTTTPTTPTTPATPKSPTTPITPTTENTTTLTTSTTTGIAASTPTSTAQVQPVCVTNDAEGCRDVPVGDYMFCFPLCREGYYATCDSNSLHLRMCSPAYYGFRENVMVFDPVTKRCERKTSHCPRDLDELATE